MSLKGSQTEQNLKAAFAAESQINRLYLYFAQKAEIEGLNDLAALFRSAAEGETGHALGLLEFLEEMGDPIGGQPLGDSLVNLAAAVGLETRDGTETYPKMAETVRDEGFAEVAEWFETLARAEKAHADRFRKALQDMCG